MKNIFLDTNVVIDFLINRQPFALHAAKLFNYALLKKVRIYISAVSYNNIHYILRKSLSNKEAIKSLNELSEMAEIADVTKIVIKKSLQSDFKDFEDAIQYYCALSLNKIDFIVTRDINDFKKSAISIITPEEAINLLESTV